MAKNVPSFFFLFLKPELSTILTHHPSHPPSGWQLTITIHLTSSQNSKIATQNKRWPLGKFQQADCIPRLTESYP